MQFYSGIDVGGTKIYAVIINEEGEILGRAKEKIGGNNQYAIVLEKIYACYQKALKKAGISEQKIKAVGFAFPSAIDIKEGLLKYAPNLGWKNIYLVKDLKERFKKAIFIDNDVNMGTFGEYCFGEGHHYNSIYGLFVGTGIGGGYIYQGNIIRGLNYTAGEIGHMVIKMKGPVCNCGNKGCLEAIAAKVGMIRTIKKVVSKISGRTVLDQISPQWRQSVGSSALKEAYLREDPAVVKAIKKSALAIGVAAANLVNVMGLQAIILGGGVIEEMGSIYIPIIEKKMQDYSIANGARGIKLLQSSLGDDAVALGAAWFVQLPEKKHFLFQ